MLMPQGDESEEASGDEVSSEEAEENIEGGFDAEEAGEIAEEEDLDDDPIFQDELFSHQTGGADLDDGRQNGEGILDLEACESPQIPPDVVEVDGPAPLPSASAASGPSLVVRQQPNRRHHQHPKSLSFGCFFVKYRDDRGRSALYADRVPSWTVMCPVHAGNCYLVDWMVDGRTNNVSWFACCVIEALVSVVNFTVLRLKLTHIATLVETSCCRD